MLNAKEWFEAASRMCDSYKDCEDCPLNRANCPMARLEYEDINAVMKWAAGNPAEPAEITRTYTIEYIEVITDDRVRNDNDMQMLGDEVARQIMKRMPDARSVRCVDTDQRVTEWRKE